MLTKLTPVTTLDTTDDIGLHH